MSIKNLLIVVFIFMPNFVYAFNMGSVNSIIYLGFSVLALVKFFKIEKSDYLYITFFVFCFVIQLLSLFSTLIDFDGASNIGLTTIRPLIIFIQVSGFYFFFKSKNCLITENDVAKVCKIIIFICFSFFVLKNEISSINNVVFNVFYVAPNKIFLEYSSILFFASTYFSSFIYVFCFVFIFYDFMKSITFTNAMLVLANILLIFYSVSKTGAIAMIATVLLVSLFKSRNFFVKISYIVLFSFIGMWLYLNYIESISSYRLIVSFQEIFTGGGGQNSADDRLDQIIYAVIGSYHNYFLGLGSGQNVLNETIISDFSYRYGLLGLLLYFIFYFYVFLVMFKIRSRLIINRDFFSCGLIWIILLFILSFSSSAMEIGKGGIVNCMFLAMVFHNVRYVKQYN